MSGWWCKYKVVSSEEGVVGFIGALGSVMTSGGNVGKVVTSGAAFNMHMHRSGGGVVARIAYPIVRSVSCTQRLLGRICSLIYRCFLQIQMPYPQVEILRLVVSF